MIRKILFSLLFVLCSFSGYSSHVLGGEITYECTGDTIISGQFFTILQVQVVMYRDCDGIPFVNGRTLSGYRLIDINTSETAAFLSSNEDSLVLEDIDFVSDNPCVELPEFCIQKGTYYYNDVFVPFTQTGSVLMLQECCLSDEVENIQGPGAVGMSFVASVPPTTLTTCYNSMTFNELPPIGVCINILEDIDVSASINTAFPDNTLEYQLTVPFDDAPASFPPEDMPYLQPVPMPPLPTPTIFTADSPFASTSFPTEYDLETGAFTFFATEEGKNMVAHRVEHLDDDGEIIAFSYRVFTYIFAQCEVNQSIPAFATGENLECGDPTVNFTNFTSNANGYLWLFGDGDSSTEASPTHVYDEFIDYTATLVAFQDNIECSDTNTIAVNLTFMDSLSIVSSPLTQCLSLNNFDFEAQVIDPLNIDPEEIIYEWEFSGDGSITSVEGPSVSGLSYDEGGIYTATITATFEECVISQTLELDVNDQPLSLLVGDTIGCLPFTAQYFPTVNNAGFVYTWYVDGEEVFTGSNFTWDFEEEGFYSIGLHTFEPVTGCESFVEEIDYLDVRKNPSGELNISDVSITAPTTVEFNPSLGDTSYELIVQLFDTDGETVLRSLDTLGEFYYTYETPGEYPVSLEVINGPCVIEKTYTIDVGPPTVDPPNIFSPNKDYVNDQFYFEMYNNRQVHLSIHDNWGKLIFSSEEYEFCVYGIDANCWTGRNLQGDMVDEGMYYYVVTLPNGFKKQGTVMLVR